MMELLVKATEQFLRQNPGDDFWTSDRCNQDCTWRCIMVSGQFRSYNRHRGEETNSALSVFARGNRVY